MAIVTKGKGSVRYAGIEFGEGDKAFTLSCQMVCEITTFAYCLSGAGGEYSPKSFVEGVILPLLKNLGAKETPKASSLTMRVGLGIKAAREPYKSHPKVNGVAPQVRLTEGGGYANAQFAIAAQRVCKAKGWKFVDKV